MANLIKQQILKQLSRYTKNLSIDQISLEVLKGRGHLNTLELNEDVLNEVLGLPSWLSVKKAVCIRVAIKVPWTRLKSSPLQVIIEEIQVELVISSILRPPNGNSAHFSADTTGLASRVVEGMSIYVNSLEAYVNCEVFDASIMLSRISLESRTPTWQLPKDLHMTRLTDKGRGQVLIFKQVDWQTFRVEVTLRPTQELAKEKRQTPLKLVSGSGKARITLRKSIADGLLLRSRVQLIMADLLWVAGAHQLRDFLKLSKYFGELYEASKEQLVAQRIPIPVTPVKAKNDLTSELDGSAEYCDKKINVVETSYHLYVSRLDIQLTADKSTDGGSRYSEPWMVEASMQISLDHLVLDMYPYHVASDNRSSWMHYVYNHGKGPSWTSTLMDFYATQLRNKLGHLVSPEVLKSSWSCLGCRVIVLRLGDLRVSNISMPNESSKTSFMLGSDRTILKAPVDIPLIHFEFTDYYFLSPPKLKLPCPPKSCFIDVGPTRLVFHPKTLLWLHHVLLDVLANVHNCSTNSNSGGIAHVDLRVEVQMPRVVIPLSEEADMTNRLHCPSEMDFCASTVTITNSFVDPNRDWSNLKIFLSKMVEKKLFSEKFQLGSVCIDPVPIQTDSIRQYFTWLVQALDDTSRFGVPLKTIDNHIWTESIKELSDLFSPPAASDVVSLEITSGWGEFRGNQLYYPKPLPFVADFSFTSYLIRSDDSSVSNVVNTKEQHSMGSTTSLYLMCAIESALRVSLDQYQYLSVLQLTDELAELLNKVTLENSLSNKANSAGYTLCVTMLVPLLEWSLLLPSNNNCPPDVNNSLDYANGSQEHSEKEYRSDERLEDINAAREFGVISCDETLKPFPEFVAKSEDTESTALDETASIATDLSDDNMSVILESEGADWMYGDIFQFAEWNVEATDDAAEQLSRQRRAALCSRLGNQHVVVVAGTLREIELIFGAQDKLLLGCVTAHKIEVSEAPDGTLEDFHHQFDKKMSLVKCDSFIGNGPLPPLQVSIRSEIPSGNSAGLRVWEINSTLTQLKVELSRFSLRRLTEFFDVDQRQSGVNLRATLKNLVLMIRNPEGPPMSVELHDVSVQRSNNDDSPLSAVLNSCKTDLSEVDQLREENANLRKKLLEAKALIQQLAQNNLQVDLR